MVQLGCLIYPKVVISRTNRAKFVSQPLWLPSVTAFKFMLVCHIIFYWLVVD